MPKPSPRPLVAILLLAIALAGCGSARTSEGPSTSVAPSTASSGAASVTGIPFASPSPTPLPTPIAEVPLARIPTACLTLGEADCMRAAAAAVGALAADDPAPIYLQVGPFGCRTGERCPTTLAARPEGDVLVEFPAASASAAISIHLVLAADGSLTATRGEAFGVVVAPSSTTGGPAGPIPFSLGHCGIHSGVDVDGSWWDPVGLIDADHADSINAAAGILAFEDPDHARFASNGGLIIQLLRRDGSKHLPFCM